MNLTKIVKDFLNPRVHEAINNFIGNGKMLYADRNFPEQILLANEGYISVRAINFGVLELDKTKINYEWGRLNPGRLNPDSIKGFKYVPINIMCWTNEGILFQYLKHPIRALYCKITGESF